MPNYRRCYVPGGSYFFTVVTERRAPILGNDLARDLLRAAFRDGVFGEVRPPLPALSAEGRRALRARIRLRIGAKKDGTFVAKQSQIVADNGAYCSLAPKVVSQVMALTGQSLSKT